MTALPHVRLADLLDDVRPGFACGEEDPAGILQIRMNNVTPDGRLDLSKRRLVPNTHRSVGSTTLSADDVLFNATNSPELVGKTVLIRELNEPMVFSNHFLRLRTDSSKINPAYLAHWLRSQFSAGVFKSMCRRWVNQATVSKSSLLSLAVPLPSLSYQEQAAEVLNQTAKLRFQRRRAITLLDDLSTSMFLETFGDPVSNSQGWPTKSVGEIGRVVTGNTPPRSNKSNYGDAIEWIKSDNIDPSRRITLTRAAEGLSPQGMKVGRIVDPGSLLVTCIAGSPNSIGNVAIADRRVAFNQQINALVPHKAKPLFLLMHLRVGKRLVQLKSTGGMKGLVSKSQFESIRLIDPPAELQQDFAARVAAVDALRASQHNQATEMDALFASVQYRAFRGELWEDMAG